jgi:hypothetical protein
MKQPDDREILLGDETAEDPLVAEQEDAAAAEAARIGGRTPAPDTDPAERPVREAGGGEAEGFEEAEAALVRQASHEDPGTSATQEYFDEEVESDRETAVGGEPDEVDPTED